MESNKKKSTGRDVAIGFAGALIGAMIAGAAAYFMGERSEPEEAENPMTESQAAAVVNQNANQEAVTEIEAFTCPITCQTIREPATSVYGHLYEHSAILEWVKKHKTCPLTGQPLEEGQIFKQYSVKEAIKSMQKLQEEIGE
jgi:hypothetical protein